MRKLIITDLDETINNCNDIFPLFVAQQYKILKNNKEPYCKNDIKSYDIGKHIPLPKHMNGNAVHAFCDFVKTGNFMYMDPKPFAVETIKKLSNDYDIILLTARIFGNDEIKEKLRKGTYEWLTATGIDNYLNMVVFTKGSDEKVDFCKKNKKRIFAFIDDRLKTIKEVAKLGINSILFNNPWNYNLKNTPEMNKKIKRAYDWKDVYSIINTIKETKHC